MGWLEGGFRKVVRTSGGCFRRLFVIFGNGLIHLLMRMCVGVSRWCGDGVIL